MRLLLYENKCAQTNGCLPFLGCMIVALANRLPGIDCPKSLQSGGQIARIGLVPNTTLSVQAYP